jgi:Glycosyltransferase family 87
MLGLLLIALFATEFLVRGPARFLSNEFNDFISPLVQSRAWVSGADPYSPRELLRLLPKDALHSEYLARDAAAGTMAAKDGIPSPYPITCFALLSPLSQIKWSVTKILWLAINFSCVLLLIAGLISFAELSWTDPLTYIFCGLALGFAPLHTALASGNLIMVVSACAVIAVWSAKRDYEWVAGVLLGVAVCLKPTVGFVFLAYYFFSRRWHTALTGAAVTATVAVVAILRYGLTVTRWLPSYRLDISRMFGAGGINDFSTANYLRFQLLNLQMPTYSVIENLYAANVIAWGVTGVLILYWIKLFVRRTDRHELLALSALATLALLPVYHRFMDAVVLLLPLCWCLTTREPKHKRMACVVLLLVFFFLIPGASLLAILAVSGRFSNHVVSSWWWNVLLMPHEAWAILAISLSLLYAMSVGCDASNRKIHDCAETEIHPTLDCVGC